MDGTAACDGAQGVAQEKQKMNISERKESMRFMWD